MAANGLAALGAHCLPTLACFSETPMGERARWHVVLPSEWHARDIKIIAVSVAEFFFFIACLLLTDKTCLRLLYASLETCDSKEIRKVLI